MPRLPWHGGMSLAQIDDVRNRFDRIVSAPRGEAAAAPERPASSRPFSPYVDDDVAEAAALAMRLSDLTRHHGGGVEGLEVALAEAERQLTAEQLQGLVQYALKLFVTRDPTAKQYLRLGRLERRQPNAVRGVAGQFDTPDQE
jgi:hypothetical protein